MTSKNTTTIWITKYALTMGIYPLEALDARSTRDTAWVEGTGPNEYDQVFHKKEFYHSREDAVARAEELRVKKIKSLEKQIAKLKALKF